MALAQSHVSGSTPMGATLVADGATFRLWAPAAEHVYVVIDGAGAYHPRPDDELVKDPVSGHWTGFVAGVGDGSKYRFFVVGRARSGFKRDPWARELEFAGYPDCDCIVRDPTSFPWHDAGFRPPAFSELIVYQFHVGR